MANCKVCGKPVKSAPVFHERCFERVLESVSERIYEDYCRHSQGNKSAAALEELCSECPLNQLHQLCD